MCVCVCIHVCVYVCMCVCGIEPTLRLMHLGAFIHISANKYFTFNIKINARVNSYI